MALLTAIAALATWASSALADSATIGSDLTRSFSLSDLVVSGVQRSTSGPLPLLAPGNGVVTSWAVRTGPGTMGRRYTLFILHPRTDGSGGYVVGPAAVAPDPVPDAIDAIRSYPAGGLPIGKGDAIGMSPTQPVHTSSNPADVLGNYNEFGTGQTLGPPASNSSGVEMLLQATEVFCKAPDVRGLKRADAAAAITAHDCTAAVTNKPTRKRKKRNRVLTQATAPGTTGAPGTAVQIVIGKFKKRR
jgi:hypothetical protein